jgi:hypothetical protein
MKKLMLMSVAILSLASANICFADQDPTPFCSDKPVEGCISEDELNSEDGDSEDSPKGYRTTFDQKMSESSCQNTILALATEYGVGIDGNQLISEEEQVGEAYYSAGSCHFYIW